MIYHAHIITYIEKNWDGFEIKTKKKKSVVRINGWLTSHYLNAMRSIQTTGRSQWMYRGLNLWNSSHYKCVSPFVVTCTCWHIWCNDAVKINRFTTNLSVHKKSNILSVLEQFLSHNTKTKCTSIFFLLVTASIVSLVSICIVKSHQWQLSLWERINSM